MPGPGPVRCRIRHDPMFSCLCWIRALVYSVRLLDAQREGVALPQRQEGFLQKVTLELILPQRKNFPSKEAAGHLR